MSARVGTRGKAVGESDKGKKPLERRRKPVHLTLDGQVWTLAKQKFPNVSRIVESLLEMALGLKSSVEIVRIGDLGLGEWGRGVAWSILPASGAGNPGSNPGGPTKKDF